MSSTKKTKHYNLPQFIGSDIPTWLGDFNSAMTAIDTGINAAATSASGAATTAAQALEAANRCPLPVGFGGFFQTNPNTLYRGTTWEQKKDVFILAAGDTYPAGSTGGEAQHILTADEMPRHDHQVHPLGDHYITAWGADSPEVPSFGLEKIEKTSGGATNRAITEKAGDDQPHNNMPPYYSMPFWVRTA